MLEDLAPDAVIADKGYDSDAFVERLEARDITPVIPPKANRKEIRDCDFALYCERNLVERFFNKIKHYRAIATRFDKLANTFLAGVLLVCVVLGVHLPPWLGYLLVASFIGGFVYLVVKMPRGDDIDPWDDGARI